MKLHQKKRLSYLSFIFPLLLISGCTSTYDRARAQIFDVTKIEIPRIAKLEYNYNNEVFSGRASRYAVFGFEDKPKEFLTTNSFSDIKSHDFEESFDRDASTFYEFVKKETGEAIREDYLVNWDTSYSYLHHKENVYFIYFDISKKLITYIVGW